MEIIKCFAVICTLHETRKNLILTKVVEERWIEKSDYSTKSSGKLIARRELGQAMIPGERLVRIEINRDLFEKTLGHGSKSISTLL